MTVFRLFAVATLAVVAPMALAPCATGDEADAQSPTDLWEGWECGTAIPLTPRLVKATVSEATTFPDDPGVVTSYPGGHGLPPFLVGRLPATEFGVLLFVRDGEQWRGYALQEGADVAGVFIAKDRASAVIFTQFSREALSDLMMLTTHDGFRTISCTSVPEPAHLQTLEAEVLQDFNADAVGHGTLITSVDREFPKETRLWYRAATAHLGVDNWSTPRRIRSEPPALKGIYAPTSKEGLADLLRSLSAASDQ